MPVTDFYTDVVKFFFIDSPHFIKNSLTKVGKGRLLRPRVIYFFFFAKWDQPFQTILYAWELPGNQTDVHKQFKQKKTGAPRGPPGTGPRYEAPQSGPAAAGENLLRHQCLQVSYGHLNEPKPNLVTDPLFRRLQARRGQIRAD